MRSIGLRGLAFRHTSLSAALAVSLLVSPVVAAEASNIAPGRKSAAAFYPAALVARAKTNAARYPWAREARRQILDAARPWAAMSDEELWRLVFGNTIKRAWQVWSNGHCPACRKSVPMYTWEMDALKHPWKTRCPHCNEYFPKNDFEKFYRSGLDEHNVFDPKRADRSLLFHTDHPDPADPQHRFGVDDGEGYVDGTNRRRFIGAYLIYGQWKQAIVAGIRNLAAAHVVTGDPAYAHKCGVLLDRVADLYPTFDFGKQGVMYEGPPRAGYVSTWHDACEETREMVLAYDQVFEAIRRDTALAEFLGRMAARYAPPNPKRSIEDVLANIEDRILRDALNNRDRVFSNYPRTEIAVATIETVLGWPANREQVYAMLDKVLARATEVDGVTGEKGLAGYTAFTIQGLAILLEQYARLDPTFLPDLIRRCPRLRETYRFHIDTWCLQQYYPLIGDTGAFAAPVKWYVGVGFSPSSDLGASMYSFLWHLYEATGDRGYVQVLVHANANKADDLPHDLFAENPAALQASTRRLIRDAGGDPAPGSINKEQWHLAILRDGNGADARAAWLAYDSGGSHGHANGMNLGLFAKGLDLLPDFGYPPVQYGGWGAPRSVWYTMTAAHNTVVVDGRNHRTAAGKTTLWAPQGRGLKAVRASGPALIEGRQFERTVVSINIWDRDFYMLDVFRVVGGTEHVKFTSSHYGLITTQGLSLEPCEDYGRNTQMRNFRHDPQPPPCWSVDWQIEDRLKLLAPERRIGFRYTDLTSDAEAGTAEAWVATRGFDGSDEAWIPRVFVRRRAALAPLASTFVAVLEPYERNPSVRAVRRLPLVSADGAACSDGDVAVEVLLATGERDLLIAVDTEEGGRSPVTSANASSPRRMRLQRDWGLRYDGGLCMVRRDGDGRLTRIWSHGGTILQAGDVRVMTKKTGEPAEIWFEIGAARVITGDAVVERDRAASSPGT